MKRNKIVDNALYLFFLSVGISAVSLVLCGLIMAAVAYSGKDPTKNVALFSLLTLALSAFFSGIIVSRLKGDDGVKFAGLVALAMMLLLLIIALITEKGHVGASAFMNYACYIGVSLLSAHLGRKVMGSHRKRRR